MSCFWPCFNTILWTVWRFLLGSKFLLWCWHLCFFSIRACFMAVPHDNISWIQSHSKCLADLCGALHCDLVMNSKTPKAKCNPAAAVRNRHLCEVVFDSYLLALFQSGFLPCYSQPFLCSLLLIAVFLLIMVSQQAVFMVPLCS